jgi:thymidylate synthase
MLNEWFQMLFEFGSSGHNKFYTIKPANAYVDSAELENAGEAWQKDRQWGEWNMDWFSFTTHCVFPFKIYEKYGCDIRNWMRNDLSLRPVNQKLNGKGITFSYFGRLCNWYDYTGWMLHGDKAKTFNQIEYLLDRMIIKPEWAKKPIRGLQAFTFYTTSPAWLYEELAKNMNQPKTGRTNWACMMMISFHFYEDKLHLTAVFRNLYATHALGDMCGLKLMLDAICKEAKLEPGSITIHALHFEFDEKAKVKQLYKGEL